MKTNLKTLAIAAVMFGTLSGYGMETIDTQGNNVEVVNHKKATQTWTIKDVKGNTVYQKEGETDSLSLNAIQLKDGSYTLEVEKGYEIQITPMSVKNGVASLKRAKATTIHKPVFRKESNKVLVSQLAVDSKALEVKIYFDGEIIFDDVVTGGTVLGRIYRLRKDIKGDYKVVMKANDRTYTNEFSL